MVEDAVPGAGGEGRSWPAAEPDFWRQVVSRQVNQVTRKGVGQALLERRRLGQLKRGLMQTLPGGCTHGVPGSLTNRFYF